MASISNTWANQNIDWTDFHFPSPPLGLTERIQKVAGSVFVGLAACSGAGALAVAIAVTATPILLVGGFAGLALVSVALAVGGIYLLCKGPHENDPDLLRKNANDAGRDIQNHHLGFEVIRQRYGQLLDAQKINARALQRLVNEDAERLSYADFRSKHSNQFVFDFITDETRAILRSKYLETLTGGALENFESRDARGLHVNYAAIASRVVSSEGVRAGSYLEFIQRNGPHILSYIEQEADKQKIALTFLQHAATLPLAPSREVERHFASECRYLSSNVGAELKALSFEQEKRQFLAGRLSYTQLRERADFALLQRGDQHFLAKLRTAFLSIPYNEAIGERYAPDRQLFGINDRELESLRREHWRAMSVAEILRHDRNAFFTESVSLFGRRELVLERSRHEGRLGEIQERYRQEHERLRSQRDNRIAALDRETRLSDLLKQRGWAEQEDGAASSLVSRGRTVLQGLQNMLSEANKAQELLRQKERQLQDEEQNLQPVANQQESVGRELGQARRDLADIEREVAREVARAQESYRVRRSEIENQLRPWQEALEAEKAHEEAVNRLLQDRNGMQQQLFEMANLEERQHNLLSQIEQETGRQQQPVTGIWKAFKQLPQFTLTRLQNDLNAVEKDLSLREKLGTRLAGMESIDAIQRRLSPVLEAKNSFTLKISELQSQKTALETTHRQQIADIHNRHNLSHREMNVRSLQQRSGSCQTATLRLQCIRQEQALLREFHPELLNRSSSLLAAIQQQRLSASEAEGTQNQAQRALATAQQQHDAKAAWYREQREVIIRRYDQEEESELLRTRAANLAQEMALYEQNLHAIVRDIIGTP